MALYKMVYVDEGNVVRQTQVRDLEDRESWEREAYRRWKRRQSDRLWAHRKIKCQNRFYVFMMTLRLALIALVLVSYIHVQNDITMRLGHISSLERQLTELKKNNESMLKRLSATGDLTAIMDKARKKYGMDYATGDQIVYYSLAKEDFVDQYHKVD